MSELEKLKAENEALKTLLNINNTDNEGTESPWWGIIMPRQIMKKDGEAIAHCIKGIYFSREAAEAHLNSRRYEYGGDAIVYCFSGDWSREYKEALRAVLVSINKKWDL